MKLEVLIKLWLWIDEGHNPKELADYFYINPDVIDTIIELKKTKVNLNVTA